jgi:hypothetical protein
LRAQIRVVGALGLALADPFPQRVCDEAREKSGDVHRAVKERITKGAVGAVRVSTNGDSQNRNAEALAQREDSVQLNRHDYKKMGERE